MSRRSTTAGAVGLGAVVLALAPTLPAFADASGSTLGAVQDVTARGKVTISGTAALDSGDSVKVTITGPQGGPSGGKAPTCTRTLKTLTSADNGQFSATFDTEDAYPTPDCSDGYDGPTTAWNGTWTVALSGAGATATQTFAVTIAPKAPTGLKVAPTATGLHVTWAPNPEPDLQGYAVNLDGGNPSAVTLDHCGTDYCAVDLPVTAAGQHTVGLLAYRSAKPGDSTIGPVSTVATAQATIAAGGVPTSPSPGSSPHPSASPASPGVPGTSPTPKAGESSEAVVPPASGSPVSPTPFQFGTATDPFTKNFTSKFPNAITLPKLNLSTSAVPSGTPSVLPGDEGVPGGYSALNYDNTRTVTTDGLQANENDVPLASVANAIGVAPDTFWRSIGGGALLVLTFLHMQVFMRRRMSEWE